MGVVASEEAVVAAEAEGVVAAEAEVAGVSRGESVNVKSQCVELIKCWLLYQTFVPTYVMGDLRRRLALPSKT